MAAVYRLGSGWFAPSVDCAINGFMHSAPARRVIWFYGYPKPTAAARARSF
jgi:hypothetical protein